jgi:hypothetical protein
MNGWTLTMSAIQTTSSSKGSTLSPVLQQFMLNANQIKIIALVIMTIDHIGAFMPKVPWVAGNYVALRTIGRIAAPLFLFLLTESVRHTRSRPRFALRLYVANLAAAAVSLLRNALLSPLLGQGHTGNIFQTFLVTALAISMVDLLVSAAKKKDLGALLKSGGLAALLVLPVFANRAIQSVARSLPLLAEAGVSLTDLSQALLPSILSVEYTPIFVALGTLWYFTSQRIVQALTLAAFALIPRFGLFSGTPYLAPFTHHLQFWMVLAAPFMLLYNGQKGGGTKYFFYVYYIVHPYVLIALARLLS